MFVVPSEIKYILHVTFVTIMHAICSVLEYKIVHNSAMNQIEILLDSE